MTPHTLSVYVWVCGLLWWGADKKGDRVGVKFLGQKIWPKIEKKGRGNKREDDSRPPLQEGSSSSPFRSLLPWCRTFCQRCFGYFSQYKKKSVNNKTPKGHGERPTHLHKLGHLAITKSATVKSYRAQTNTITRGGSNCGRREPRIRHTQPNASYCICPVSTQ